MRVLALIGSPSFTSINAALTDHALSLLPEGTQVDRVSVLELNQPFYQPDIEAASGVPADLVDLHARIAAADAVILASPEHNGGMPAMLKNTLDWLSRVKQGTPWLPRPLLLLSASPGGRGGAGNLKAIAGFAPWWGATVVGSFSLGGFYKAFDSGRPGLVDPAQARALQDAVASLVSAAAS